MSAQRSHYAYTRRWLEDRFRRVDAGGVFVGHMPIYGHRGGPSEPGRLPRLARALQILRTLDRMRFATFLDVGSADGYIAWVTRRVFGAEVFGCDLSVEACRRASELFDLDAVACDAERLPFPDGAFDVVLSSETIEHVEHPVQVLLELQRVARRAVVLTTEEVSADRAAIDRWLALRCGYPHSERNRFHPDDLRAVFGDDVELWTQFVPPRPTEPMSDEDARRWLHDATPDAPGLHGAGIVAVAWLDPDARRPAGLGKDALCDALCDARVEQRPLAAATRTAPRDALLGRLACPLDREPLAYDGAELRSARGRRYAILPGGVAALHARTLAPVPAPDLGAAIRDPVRRERVRELGARLAMPDTTGVTRWRFADPAARIGWRMGDQVSVRTTAGAGWALLSTGGDPDLVGPTMPFGTADIAAFEIDMRLHNPAFARDAGVGQLFWMCDGDATFREDASVLFGVVNDGAVHTYVVDPRQGRGWPAAGDLVCVRLDPVDGPCELDLVEFRIRLRAD
ncbi:MAG: class I SAM-dependent methyltransferase [Planctomycetes bacterium]|nr:class I SAM-dependent methyltransferase [Planctomycetota bacterium]